WDYRDWYLRGGYFDADRVFGQWVEKEKQSLDAGYKGLRVSGDTAWVEKRTWPDFMAYEAEVNRVFPQHRMIGLCTYQVDHCTADTVLEVIRNHHVALARIAGEWERIESSNFRETSMSQQLQRLSADVLEQQDDERRGVPNPPHEMTAQNVPAVAILASIWEEGIPSPSGDNLLLAQCHPLCEQSLEQPLPPPPFLPPPVLDELGLAACLRRYVDDFMKQSRIHVELETDMDMGRLPLQVETHLFRVAQEGLANILRHSGSLNAVVRLHRQADEVVLEVEDFGAGMTATAAAAVSDGAGKGGIGILGMQERLRKIGGQLEIRSNNQGTLLTASIRVS